MGLQPRTECDSIARPGAAFFYEMIYDVSVCPRGPKTTLSAAKLLSGDLAANGDVEALVKARITGERVVPNAVTLGADRIRCKLNYFRLTGLGNP